MRRFFLAFSIVIFAMGANAQAGTIFQFFQQNLADQVTATDTAGVTTLSTKGNADGNGLSIPVFMTGTGIVPGTIGYETYVNVMSTGPATLVNGLIAQPFTGTIEFTSIAGGGGTNYLTATFQNVGLAGSLTGPFGGTAATLAASSPSNLLTLTSDVLGQLLSPNSMAIGYSNVTPFLSIAPDGSIDNFVTQNAGTFSASVPEPNSMVLSMIGMGSVVFFARMWAKLKRRKPLIA